MKHVDGQKTAARARWTSGFPQSRSQSPCQGPAGPHSVAHGSPPTFPLLQDQPSSSPGALRGAVGSATHSAGNKPHPGACTLSGCCARPLLRRPLTTGEALHTTSRAPPTLLVFFLTAYLRSLSHADLIKVCILALHPGGGFIWFVLWGMPRAWGSPSVTLGLPREPLLGAGSSPFT